MAKTREEWIERAIDLALENVRAGHGGPFGALIIKHDEIVATGVNLVTATSDPTAHAEIVAIRRACQALHNFQLEDCELFANCEPCPMCLGAIYWARPAAYYFSCTRADATDAGFDDAFIYDQLLLPPEKRVIRGRRVSAENALTPFLEWSRSSQKIQY